MLTLSRLGNVAVRTCQSCCRNDGPAYGGAVEAHIDRSPATSDCRRSAGPPTTVGPGARTISAIHVSAGGRIDADALTEQLSISGYRTRRTR